MKVLVTGGSGFLGSHLIGYFLEKGFEVRATQHFAPIALPPHPNLEVVSGNLQDFAFLQTVTQGVEAVFHVAAKAGIWGTWDAYFTSNILTTRYLLNAAQNNQVKYFIYTSSASVVFHNKSLQGINETFPYPRHWNCHYTHSKAVAEQEVLKATLNSKIATVALRPHLIWGPGDRQLVPRLLQRAQTGRLYQVGDGSNCVDTLYIDNAVQAHGLALQALMEGKARGKAYFIAQEGPINLWNWIRQLVEAHQLPFAPKRLSLRAGYLLGGCFEGIYKLLHIQAEPPLTRFLALQSAKHCYFNIQAAKTDLGYQPLVSTAQGLQRLQQAAQLLLDRPKKATPPINSI